MNGISTWRDWSERHEKIFEKVWSYESCEGKTEAEDYETEKVLNKLT